MEQKKYYAEVHKKITAKMVEMSQLYSAPGERYESNEVGKFERFMGRTFNDIQEVWDELKEIFPERPETDYKIVVTVINRKGE